MKTRAHCTNAPSCSSFENELSHRPRDNTPEFNPPLSPIDTPMLPRVVENFEYLSRYTKYQRDVIIKHIGGVVSLGSIDYFFKNVLPTIPTQFSTKRILEYCLVKEVLIKERHRGTTEYHWKDFSTKPENSTSHETLVFNHPLMNIFTFISESAQLTQKEGSKTVNQTTELHADGNKPTWSEKESDLRPDAHIFLKEHNLGYPDTLEGHHWYNSALALHFKKSGKSEDSYEVVFISIFLICY